MKIFFDAHEVSAIYRYASRLAHANKGQNETKMLANLSSTPKLKSQQ